MQDRTRVSNLARNYTDLKVYRLAFDSAMQINQKSKGWPREEKYSLVDQIKRSSRSVCGNIAEAWRKRRYPAYFISKLSDADAEAAETEVWLSFAKECGYINEVEFSQLYGKYNHICKMLTIMMTNANDWKLKSK